MLTEFSYPLIEHCFADTALEFLEQIESGQFFISSVNTQVNEQPETVFRFHPLFRQYLSQRYQQNTQLTDINEFRLNLAHWLAANQQRIAAISLALEANALELAEQWISQCAMDLVEQGDSSA